MNRDLPIQEYRTFQIWYDEEYDVFFSELADRYEMKKEPTRKSLAALRAEIDKHYKANLNFKPFTCYYGTDWGNEEKSLIKIISVKKDGGLIYEECDPKASRYGKHQHLSSDSLHGKEYDGKKKKPILFLVNANNVKIGEMIKDAKKQIEKLLKSINLLSKEYEPLDISFINDFTKTD